MASSRSSCSWRAEPSGQQATTRERATRTSSARCAGRRSSGEVLHDVDADRGVEHAALEGQRRVLEHDVRRCCGIRNGHLRFRQQTREELRVAADVQNRASGAEEAGHHEVPLERLHRHEQPRPVQATPDGAWQASHEGEVPISDHPGIREQLLRARGARAHAPRERRRARDGISPGERGSPRPRDPLPLLPELADELPEWDVASEHRRIELQYGLGSIRELYSADPDLPTGPTVVRAAHRAGRAGARAGVDEFQPDVVVPEVGRETPRLAAHELARARGIPTFFLFYTIFPNPLRLYVDTMHAPVVPPESLRPLAPDEQREVDEFRNEFVERSEPIRPLRRQKPTKAGSGAWRGTPWSRSGSAGGKAKEFGFGGITDILLYRERGLRLVWGPLPAEIQNYANYSAAVISAAPDPDGAKAFMAYLASPEGRALFLANGIPE